jgi:hypothetical protein
MTPTDLADTLDTLIDAATPDGWAAAGDALAASPEGRRLLVLFEALNEPPETGPVPDVSRAVLARLVARPVPAARPASAATTPATPWDMALDQLHAWLASIGRRPALALGGVVAVLLLALLLGPGPSGTGGVTGAAMAVTADARWWLAATGLVVGVALAGWWLWRR